MILQCDIVTSNVFTFVNVYFLNIIVASWWFARLPNKPRSPGLIIFFKDLFILVNHIRSLKTESFMASLQAVTNISSDLPKVFLQITKTQV